MVGIAANVQADRCIRNFREQGRIRRRAPGDELMAAVEPLAIRSDNGLVDGCEAAGKQWCEAVRLQCTCGRMSDGSNGSEGGEERL